MENPPLPSSEKQKRGWRWRLVLLFLSAFALNGWLRLSESLRLQSSLAAIGLTKPSPQYLIMSGAVWGILFSTTVVFHFIRLHIGKTLSAVWIMLYIFWLWMERLIVSQPGSLARQMPGLFFYTAAGACLCAYFFIEGKAT